MERCLLIIIGETQIKMTMQYLLGWLSSKRQRIKSIGGDVEKMELLYPFGRNVNWYNHYGESMKVPEKLKKQNYYMIQQPHFWVYTQRK